MKQLLFDMLKNSTGDGLCPVRVVLFPASLLMVLLYAALAAYMVVADHHVISLVDFGGGVASIFAAVGGAIALKSHAEKR